MARRNKKATQSHIDARIQKYNEDVKSGDKIANMANKPGSQNAKK